MSHPTGWCPDCRREHRIVKQVAAKVALPALATLVVGGSTRSVLSTALSAAAGLAVGYVVDEVVASRCPACGTLLEIVEAFV